MGSPPVATTAAEKADHELGKLRDRLQEYSKDLTNGIRRFQIVSLIALAVLCLLLSNEDFRPRKWLGFENRLTAWEERNKLRGPIRRVPYSYIETYELQEAYRKGLTDSILRTTVASEIPAEATLQQVSELLGDRYYGVDFLYLHNVEESLSIMSEIVGAKVMKDLSNYRTDGHPLKPPEWLSIKGWFFSDNVLFGHRLLAERLPYEPEEGVQEYVKSARKLIGEIKQKYPDADREWTKHRVGLHNDIRYWPWIAWTNLSDSTVSEWKSLLTESVGAANEATLSKIGKAPDFGSVIDWLKHQLAELAKTEREAAETKATFWSVTFSVPLRVIVLLFPLIFAGARCALAELRLYLRLNLVRTSAIEAVIDRGLGSYQTLLERLRAPSMELPGAFSGWNTLRSFPLLFTEIAFEIAASMMAAYVLYRGIRLAYVSPAGWINSVLYSVMIIAALVLGIAFVKTSRSATKTLSERLTVET